MTQAITISTGVSLVPEGFPSSMGIRVIAGAFDRTVGANAILKATEAPAVVVCCRSPAVHHGARLRGANGIVQHWVDEQRPHTLRW